ncbi:hypothetical protein ACFL35_08260 [Candidatus Riflebacteria bacterium]
MIAELSGKKISLKVGSADGEVGVLRTLSGKVLPGHFNGPSSFFISRAGIVYLVDALNYRVQQFALTTGKFLGSIPYGISSPQKVPNLVSDIFIGKEGEINLLDYSHQIFLTLDKKGDFLAAFLLKPILKKFPFFRANLISRSERFVYLWNNSDPFFFQWQPEKKIFKKVALEVAPYIVAGRAYELYFKDLRQRKTLYLTYNKETDNFSDFEKQIIKLPFTCESLEVIGIHAANLFFKTTAQLSYKIFSWNMNNKNLSLRGTVPLKSTLDFFRAFFIDMGGNVFFMRFRKKRLVIAKLKKSAG